jgi:hypothetical protein
LREQLGGRRLRFTDAQRRRLATKGQALGRRVLQQLAGLVTPDTITAIAAPVNDNADPAAPIARRERLGGLLSYYYRAAA